MKFVCDSCRAQYMISDDKVGPAGVKVRCKRCSNVILVKRVAADLELTQGPPADTTPPEPAAPPAPRALDDEIGDALDNVMAARTPGPETQEPEATAPAPAGPDPEQVEWYVAIGEEQTGPLRFEEVRARWESAAVGPDTLAWRTGLPDWKPLSQIPELALRLSPRGGPAVTPGRGIPIITGNRGAWETPAAAPSARAPAPAQDDGWKPSAASALASLVEQEIQAARKPEAPAKSAPPVPETTNVRALLGNLPEPPPAEPSRLIPIADKSGPVRVERTSSRTGFWGSPSRGGLGRVAVLSAGIAVGALLLVLVGLWVLGVVQLPGAEPPHRQRVAVAPPAAPAAPAPAAPTPAVAPAPAAPVAAAPAPAAPTPAPAAGPATVAAGDSAAKAAPAAAGAVPPPTVALAAAAPAMPKAAPPVPEAPVERPTRTDTRHDRTAARTSRTKDRDTRPASADSTGSVLDAGGKSSVDAAFENELAGKGSTGKSGGSTYIPPAPGSSSKPGKLGQGDIMAVVVGQKAAIKGCVGRYKESGGGTGTLVMRWTILPTGRTQNVAPKGPDHAVLAGCIGKLIKDWRFPEYGGATMAPIEFPFTF